MKQLTLSIVNCWYQELKYYPTDNHSHVEHFLQPLNSCNRLPFLASTSSVVGDGAGLDEWVTDIRDVMDQEKNTGIATFVLPTEEI